MSKPLSSLSLVRCNLVLISPSQTVLRVLWNILRGGSAEDVRSDDEDDGEDDDGLIDEDDLDALPNDREVPTEPKKDR